MIDFCEIVPIMLQRALDHQISFVLAFGQFSSNSLNDDKSPCTALKSSVDKPYLFCLIRVKEENNRSTREIDAA